MMDREFDSEGVKDACDNHGVCYLNGARKRESEKATCTRLRRSGEDGSHRGGIGLKRPDSQADVSPVQC